MPLLWVKQNIVVLFVTLLTTLKVMSFSFSLKKDLFTKNQHILWENECADK